jgi:hypothetical protein
MSPLLADPPTKAEQVDKVRFGKKSENTIAVVIGGDVARAGKYFLPKGFGLKSVLGIVGGYGWNGQRKHDSAKTAQFRGGVRVYRSVGGRRTSSDHKISELQQAKSTDFLLLDEDIVEFVDLNLYGAEYQGE